ncbi:MAG TPA: serine/threonine-protein kinase [Polyangiaceae bacterium]
MSRPKPIEIGDIVAGKYRLLAMIGEGGMGVVYLAEHSLIEKRVALKVLRSEYSMKPELVSRFQQEAISASRIKHPNVLDVFDFGQLEDGSFFLAMEYLSGRDLAAELTESGTIAPERAVRIALQMCRALAVAHARGVVHRDLKPENVFLHVTEEGDEVVKIVDFGIAQLKGKEDSEAGHTRKRRLTRTGMIFGTPEYMSPEQAKGTAVDLRSDIYALGIILYEMVTGAVPFTGTTFMAVLTAHLTQPTPPIDAIAPGTAISNELEQAIMRSLEKDPGQRYQSMRELASALQFASEGRVAAPLGGLLPLPEVNVGSFRPARSGSSATAPQFNRLDPLPLDLAGTEATARPGLDRISSNTLIAGSDGISGQSATVGRFEAVAPWRWSKVALFAVTLLAAGGGTMLMRQYGTRALRRPSSDAPPRPVAVQISPTNATGSAAAEPRRNANEGLPLVSSAATGPTTSGSVGEIAPSVTLTVQANLPGATVIKDGFQVCDQTPCTVQVPRGAAVELVGTKGYARGVARVLAQRDQSVTLVLNYAKTGAKKQGGGKPGLCEVDVDGLKILRPCQ